MFMEVLFIFTFTLTSIIGTVIDIEKTMNDINAEENTMTKNLRIAVQNAIDRDLIEKVNLKSFNIFKKCRTLDSCEDLTLATAYIVQDGVNTVLFTDLKLPEFPRLKIPNSFINQDILEVHTEINKFFIHGTYNTWRNKLNLIDNYEGNNNYSPFSVRKVGKSGNVTIIVDDCKLITRLMFAMLWDEESPTMTSHTWDNCKMTVEITGSKEMRSSPVIAPYFSHIDASRIEELLGSIDHDPFGSLIYSYYKSYFNSTEIIQETKSMRTKWTFRYKAILGLVKEIVNNMNKIASQKTAGALVLPQLKFSGDEREVPEVIINATVFGLDAAHHKQDLLSLFYKGFYFGIQYKYVKFKGNIRCGQHNYLFSVELQDKLCPHMMISLENDKLSLHPDAKNSIQCKGNILKENILYSDTSLYEPFERDDRKLMDNLIKAYILENMLTTIKKYIHHDILQKAVDSINAKENFWNDISKNIS